MAKLRAFSLGSLNLMVSPFLHKEGELIRSVNVTSFPTGAKSKRNGYGTLLGTPDNSKVTALFDWHKQDGTTFWLYRVSNGIIHYSTQGTGAWTVCGNGTLTVGATPGHAVLEDTMILGDGTALSRHTTDGTSFTNTDAAPYAQFWEMYQNRIYAGGTGSDLFYSTTGTPTNWITDSTSVRIPGPGKFNGLIKIADRLVSTKNSGAAFRWDGYNLYDLSTNNGPSSPNSIKKIENFNFWLNREGFNSFDGNDTQLISNPIQRQIYNDTGTAIAGSEFDTLPSVAHKQEYITSLGTITDDLTGETVSNCIAVYDYQHNEWGNYSFADYPTAWHSYKDNNGDEQLIFGDATGQCYTFGGDYTSDNGEPIQSIIEGVLHFGSPEADKKFNYLWAFANPGCQATMQIAIADTFTKGKLNWINVGQFVDGVAEMRFPQNSDGKLMFWKLSEVSTTSRFTFYGFVLDVDVQERQ
jgi:hypothetical protein